MSGSGEFDRAVWRNPSDVRIWLYHGQPESEWPAGLGLQRRTDLPQTLWVPEIDGYISPGEVLVRDPFGLRIESFGRVRDALMSGAVLREMG